MNKIPTDLLTGEVQETLMIPLYGRAYISRRNQLLGFKKYFYDARAVEMVQNLDYNFRKMMLALPTLESTVMRTIVLDHWVRAFIKKYPTATIIEIGCGLNTRFDRVDNGQIRWFDLDLPDVQQLWTHFFSENERRTFLPYSALDPKWIEIVKTNSKGPYMMVSEASVIYFSESDVRKLWGMLADNFPGARYGFDTVGSAIVDHQDGQEIMKLFKARVKWSVDDPDSIEAWDRRFRIIQRENIATPSKAILQYYPWWLKIAGALSHWMPKSGSLHYHLNLAILR